jgi:6-pyruvoyltetrahydropterin/6-carboxytetrahydropterin synthase
MAFKVQISKERFKFSATHFTIFSEEQAESLHGHNYQVIADLTYKSLDENTGLTSEFSIIKKSLEKICERLDEKILLPIQSPFIEIGETQTNIEVKFSSRFYSFPKEECCLLEIVNTSSECLAQWLYENIKEDFEKLGAKSFSITIQESQGQKVTYEKSSLFS